MTGLYMLGAFATAYLWWLLVATGPVPITLFGGQVDHVVSALAFGVLALAALRNSRPKNKTLVTLVLLYWLTSVPSIFLSSNMPSAIRGFLVDIGYGGMFLLLTMLNVRDWRLCRYAALAALITAEILLLYLRLFSDYSETVRFAIATDYASLAEFSDDDRTHADPNATAIGMVLTFLCALPLLFSATLLRTKVTIVAALVLLIYASTLLLSRTSTVMISVVLLIVTLSLNRKSGQTYVTSRGGPWIITGMLLVVAMQALIPDGSFDALWTRFTYITEGEAQPTARIDLMTLALECFLSTPVTVGFGCGYAATNPHNEFLRVLANSGALAFLVYCAILLRCYLVARNRARRFFRPVPLVEAMFWPFVFALFTYGHTKLYWVGLSLLWLVTDQVVVASRQYSPPARRSELNRSFRTSRT